MLGFLFLASFLGGTSAVIWYWTKDDRRRARIAALATGGLVLLAVLVYRSDLSMQKLAGFLAMPSGLFWLGLGALSVHLFARGLRRPAYFALALFLADSLFGSPLLGATLVKSLEQDIPEYSLANGQTFDAVLVLGGGVGFRESGEVQLSDHGDRVILGARLWYAKKTPILVASGSTIPGFDEVQDLARAAELLWRDLGIPPEAIVKSSEPKNTSQEMAAFDALARAHGWKRLGVISSRWHLPRILRLARALELEVTPIAADYRGAKAVWHPALMVPQPGAWKATQLACWEMLGMLVGR